MARVIRYTYNGATQPADPTESSTVYTAPLVYQAGYYKAKAWEDGEVSSVTSASFGTSPTDYIAYYPLTSDFNDYVGSNNLINTGCTIDGDGCLISSSSDKLTIANGISMIGGFTISFTFTPSSLQLSVGLFGETGNSQIFRVENSVGNWGSYFYGTTASPSLDLTEQKFTIIQDGTTRKYYRNGALCLIQTADQPVLKYIGNFSVGGYPAFGYWKDIKIFNRAVTEAEAIQLTTE